MSGAERPRVLGVCGTTTPDSRTRCVLDIALEAATASGAEVRLLDLSATCLPVMIERDADQAALPEVQLVRESAAWAQGFVLASPEYHGTVSGALKNWFDFLWEELAGKTAGVLAVTSAGHATNTVQSIRSAFQWCHGWVLPFHASAAQHDFTDDALDLGRVRDRIERVGHDVAHHAPLLHAAFQARRGKPGDPGAGFAGLHR